MENLRVGGRCWGLPHLISRKEELNFETLEGLGGRRNQHQNRGSEKKKATVRSLEKGRALPENPATGPAKRSGARTMGARSASNTSKKKELVGTSYQRK